MQHQLVSLSDVYSRCVVVVVFFFFFFLVVVRLCAVLVVVVDVIDGAARSLVVVVVHFELFTSVDHLLRPDVVQATVAALADDAAVDAASGRGIVAFNLVVVVELAVFVFIILVPKRMLMRVGC